jgi:hypothetical protein
MTYQTLLDAMELAVLWEAERKAWTVIAKRSPHPDKQQEAYQAIEDINRMMSQEIK